MARVSVVIPTHSRPDLLPRAVGSARAAGRDVEVVVVDDASTDGTADLCRSLEGITYVRLPTNQGVAGARNAGLRAASADLIAFLDDDDARLADTLDAQVEVLDRSPEAGMVYSPVLLTTQDGRVTKLEPDERPSGDIFWDLLERNFIYPQSVVVRRACFLRVGEMAAEIPGIDEWDLFVRIAEVYPVALWDSPVALYRLPTSASDQLTTRLSSTFFTLSAAHQLRLLRLPRAAAAPPKRRRAARRRLLDLLSDKLVFSAAAAIAEGSPGAACRALAAAIRLNPARALRPNTLRVLTSGVFA